VEAAGPAEPVAAEWVAVSKVEWVAVSKVEWVAVSKVEWVAVSKVEWVAVSKVEWVAEAAECFSCCCHHDLLDRANLLRYRWLE
jgi:hypothetical protein